MLPEYKNVKNDLETLKNNITAIRNELNTAVKPEKLSEKTGEAYHELIRQMDLLQSNLDKLLSEPRKDRIELSLSWDSVKGTLYGFHIYNFPNVNEGDKRSVSDLTAVFNKDDKARIVWNACRKLSELNREKIATMLTEEMQEVLETYDDNIREMDSIAEKDAFIYGFRLGMQLAAESLIDRRQEK